ncbi:MarR family winged helix-turn-helix transcriptional regulator [Brevibacillus sp. NRS-1366]|uniref:MarR family winged helix-turn-helix transcriptional regulator n=1 Tax=Brevibacillus sp. NRS-1366 TaxID=3233899 RepID=UPI003D1E87D7
MGGDCKGRRANTPFPVSQNIGVTKANISILLAPLEQDGFISRTGHPEDGRKTLISLTTKGQKLLFRHLPDNRHVIAEAMKGLSETELHQLIFLLEKIKGREG